MAYDNTIPGVGCNNIRDVAPSDTVPLGPKIWGVRVGVAGNVVVRGPSNTADVTIPATAGEVLCLGNGVLIKTTTTATGLISFGG